MFHKMSVNFVDKSLSFIGGGGAKFLLISASHVTTSVNKSPSLLVSLAS